MREICLNFNFFLGGEGILKLKSQSARDLPKFQFFWGGILQLKSQSARDLPKFQFSGGGGGYSATEKSKCQRSA